MQRKQRWRYAGSRGESVRFETASGDVLIVSGPVATAVRRVRDLGGEPFGLPSRRRFYESLARVLRRARLARSS